MSWDLAFLAAAVLAYALLSRRLAGGPVTAPIAFVTFGLLAGGVLAIIESAPGLDVLATLAEATLVLVLFVDASRIRFAALRREYAVPVRLLGVGLPLTIAAGAAAALLLFPGFDVWAAVVLAVALAPTDAALGQAVVSDPRLPSRVSQGLNVESGLNDGICVPVLLVALAGMSAEAGEAEPLGTLVRQLGGGAIAGAAVGLAAVLLLLAARRRRWVTGEWEQVAGLVTAVLAYAVAVPLGGSGFIASFVAGAAFGAVWERRSALQSDGAGGEPTLLLDEVAALLSAGTFVVFGATALPDAVGDMTLAVAAYAVLSLTVVRMVPVALAMLGSHARTRTVAFLGWFGPRGLASIVFAVLVLEEAGAGETTGVIVTTIAVTVALSVYLHGMSASALGSRYARWFAARPRPAQLMESREAAVHRGPALGRRLTRPSLWRPACLGYGRRRHRRGRSSWSVRTRGARRTPASPPSGSSSAASSTSCPASSPC